MMMGTEAIKLVLGIGEPLVGRLLLYDSLRMSFKDVKVRKNPACELCGDAPTLTELIDYEAFCNVQLPTAEAVEDTLAFEITGPELKQIMETGRPITLLDVREPHEWEIARIENARLTPLSQFENFISDLNREDEIYLYCYKGKRSMTALQKLKENGFTHLKSLAGGIDHWAVEVDTSMPRY
jgi:adenylyltransferase/sulfurtransferase